MGYPLAPGMDWELFRLLAWNRHGRVGASRLFGTTRGWAAAAAVTHLSLYTSSEAPEHAMLAPLAASSDSLISRTAWPEPSAESCRGLYTDALFI